MGSTPFKGGRAVTEFRNAAISLHGCPRSESSMLESTASRGAADDSPGGSDPEDARGSATEVGPTTAGTVDTGREAETEDDDGDAVGPAASLGAPMTGPDSAAGA